MIGLSVPRVFNILNLLKLDEKIQTFILSLDGRDKRLKVITERRLRPLTKIRDPDEQKRQFVELTGVDLV